MPCKKVRTAASVLLIICFVNKSLGKTRYDKSPPSGVLYNEEELEQYSGKKETNFMNTNILNSVNNILDSFDDEHILNSMMEDIVKPVIKETMVREEEQSREAEKEAERKKEIFTKHEAVTGLRYESERYKYQDLPERRPQPWRDYELRQHQPLLVPLYQTRYGQRMRRGMARIASSVPWWQNVLQLLAAGLFVFLLPGVQYIG